jgi:hypothetical protein
MVKPQHITLTTSFGILVASTANVRPLAVPELRSKLGMPRGTYEYILLSMDFDNRGGTFMMIINSNRESISHHLWLFEHTHAVEGSLLASNGFGVRDVNPYLPHGERNGS